jgi:hypothetical protein
MTQVVQLFKNGKNVKIFQNFMVMKMQRGLAKGKNAIKLNHS